jgi:phosphopantothenoylcysteine decarboxylase/phosphopantothenate--cysteine ligase
MNVLITAGPTREAIDPVRFLSNRSSGKMGYALAQAAVSAGHQVTLISGPVHLTPPSGLQLIKVESAQQMYEAVQTHASIQDIIICAAAVADYRPKQIAEQKIKKHADELSIKLERTPDILGSLRGTFNYRGRLIGFAAETQDLLRHAQEKLTRKGCDYIIANDVSQPGIGFDSDHNTITILSPSGPVATLSGTKLELAKQILHQCS